MHEEAFGLFVKAAPATVMIRGVLENIFSPARLNAIFADAAQVQYTRDLAFSSVVRLMSQVVMRIQPSVHAAYKQQAEELGVTAKCVYNKLDGLEPQVSQALLRQTAREMELVIRTMDGVGQPLVKGLRTRILDGNHLACTDRRLQALRGQTGAALPGQSLAVLDPELKLIIDLFPCEDAHTQERALLIQVLETVQLDDLWIADRNFCTTRFLFGLHRKKAFFIIRQHKNSLRWELLGERTAVGSVPTGQVFEQAVRVWDTNGESMILRRITVELLQPTRDGEMVVDLLTNLRVEQADALQSAFGYTSRWQVETAFQELTVDLACEVSTLGYPKAALFAFSVAVSCFNAFSVTKAALRAGTKHSEGQVVSELTPPTVITCVQSNATCADTLGSCSSVEPPRVAPPSRSRSDELSTYYLADEVAGTWRGMMVVLPDEFWKEKFGTLTSTELAEQLTGVARTADLSKYLKRRPNRKPSPRSTRSRPGAHVATARILPGKRAP